MTNADWVIIFSYRGRHVAEKITEFFSSSKVSRDLELPLSRHEEYYFRHRMHRSRMNIIQVAFQLEGALNLMHLENAVFTIIRRHEILRTSYTFKDNTAIRVIHAENKDQFDVINVTDNDAEAIRTRVSSTAINIADKFDVVISPLFSVTVFVKNKRSNILLISAHHIIFDGFSVNVFLQELAVLYRNYENGEVPQLPIPVLQYADYAYWQSRIANSGKISSIRNYWMDKIIRCPYSESFPIEKSRQMVGEQFGLHKSMLTETELSHVMGFSYKTSSTLYLILLGALYVTLAQYTNRNSVAVLCPIASQPRLGVGSMMGCFVNALVLQHVIDPNLSFRKLIKNIRGTLLKEAVHAELTYNEMSELLSEKKDIFPVILNLSSLETPDFQNIECREYELEFESPVGAEVPNFLMSFTFYTQKKYLACNLHYNAKLLKKRQIEELASFFYKNLEALVAAPETLLSTYISGDQVDPS